MVGRSSRRKHGIARAETQGQCEMPAEGVRKLGHALNQEDKIMNMKIQIIK